MSLTKATLAAYERWAPVYPPVAHNPLMRAEQEAMIAAWPPMDGRRVLDLASGSGRYSRLLLEANAAQVVALDFCTPMLRQVSAASRVCASMMQLPFRDETFDCIVCGLALGHVPDIQTWMVEIARVVRAGGTFLYSDFHPQAARAGMTRSFKDQNDESCTVPHQLHEVNSQERAAAWAGLTIDTIREVRVGMELREPFPGSDPFYRQWHGLPIVLVARARK